MNRRSKQHQADPPTMNPAMNGNTSTNATSPPLDAGRVARRDVAVANPQGLHLRPASTFARLARQLPGAVTVTCHERSVNGKSQLDLLLLAAERDTILTIEVCGPDAEPGVEMLANIITNPNSDEVE